MKVPRQRFTGTAERNLHTANLMVGELDIFCVTGILLFVKGVVVWCVLENWPLRTSMEMGCEKVVLPRWNCAPFLLLLSRNSLAVNRGAGKLTRNVVEFVNPRRQAGRIGASVGNAGQGAKAALISLWTNCLYDRIEQPALVLPAPKPALDRRRHHRRRQGRRDSRREFKR